MKHNLVYNLGAAFITFFLSAFITFWMTPYIISNLGSEAYGFIPLTQNLISILSVLTVALSSVIARFFTVAITQESYYKAEGYFNTYLITSLVGSVFIFSIIVVAIIYIDKLINVPLNLLNDVRLALLFSGTLVIITFIKSLFLAGPFSQNKLYITKGIEASNAILKALFIIVLLTILTPKIWYVNLGAMIAGLISLFISIYIFKKVIPKISLNTKSFSFKKLKELLSAGAWNSIGQIGVLLFLAIELLVANNVLGATKAGIYAAIIQLPLLLRTIASIIAGVFAPVIIKNYANNNMNGLIIYSNKAVKLNGLLIALPAALMCGMAGAILDVWLGPEFIEYKWLLILNSAYLIFTLSVLPLTHIYTAVNRLRVPGIVTLFLGFLNLILAVYLAGYTVLGLYGIVLAGSIALILKNFLFIPLYSSYITKQQFSIYYKGVLQPIIGALFAVGLCIFLQMYIDITGWGALISTGIIVTLGYLIFSYVLLLNREEKQILINLIRSIVK
ncbi:MATE family efflux transporter [Sutcliffiella horikoshii]|uniref:MATE family efflux transporter n=1 Tax=Sutcliffiella horikoshii TaxID=79883 RepID=UPI003CF0B925